MTYFILSTVYSGIFYAIYFTFLRNGSTHRWNRWYLISLASFLAIVLPLIELPGPDINYPNPIKSFNVLLPGVTISDQPGVFPNSRLIGFLISIYALVAAFMAFRLISEYYSFKRLVSNKPATWIEGNIRLHTCTGIGPGSLGNTIFFPGATIDQTILSHQIAHVRNRHTRDAFIMNILCCLFWPNFMLHIVRKELIAIHEFEADDLPGIDKDSYARTLLNNIFNTNSFTLTHTFFNHPIKRRIVMLQKTPKNSKALHFATIKSGILAAAMFSGIVYLQSCNRKPDSLKTTETANQQQNATTYPANKPKVYDYVDRMPESVTDLATFLGQTIHYPEDARTRGVEGKVFVKFIIDQEGNIQSPVILRSPDQSLSDEAIRAIKLMPKWKPGTQNGKPVSVYFTLPVLFKLS